MALPPEKGPLTAEDFAAAAQLLGVDVRAIEAVAGVESHGVGFLPSGEPKILFERHLFHRFTGGEFPNAIVQGAQAQHAQLSSRTPGGYGSLNLQHKKLEAAAKLNRTAALRACSWGLFQILGDNWKACGCASLQDFVNRAYLSTAAHLGLFVGFIRSNPKLHVALRVQDWQTFEQQYNGPAAGGKYAALIGAVYERLGGNA